MQDIKALLLLLAIVIWRKGMCIILIIKEELYNAYIKLILVCFERTCNVPEGILVIVLVTHI